MDKTLRRILTAVVVLALIGGVSGAYYLSNSTPTTGEVPLSAADGPAGAVTGGVDVNATTIQKDANTTWIRSSGGNVTLTGPASGYVRFDGNINGTWTNTSAINTSGGTISINPDDKQQADVGGSIDTLDWQHSMAADDGKVDFVFSGVSGTSEVTFYNLPTSTELAAVDADNSTVLDVQTTNSNGVATFTMSNSEHAVTLQTQDGEPQVSNVKPTGNLSTPPDRISADIDDADFPDDNVTVYMYWNGTLEGTESVQSASTVSTPLSSDPVAGEHTVKVAAQDEFGDWTNKTTTFNVPDELFIYNETRASELVNGTNSTVEVKFFADQTIISRNTTDGSINLTGLPVNQRLIVSASSSGYYSRTVVIKSLYQQQEVYLLSTNITATETRFRLGDQTGTFPREETTLYVSKPITKSGSTEWRIIASDRFGATGITTNLEKDERYRLTVENERGDTRSVGPYVADLNESVPLQPGVAGITLDKNASGLVWGAEYQNESGSPKIIFSLSDPKNATDQLTVSIHERGNKSNEIYSVVKQGPIANITLTKKLTQAQAEKTWVVNWSAERNGQTLSGKKTVGKTIRGVIGSLDAHWKMPFAVGITTLLAAAFSRRNYLVGATVVPIIAGTFWYAGWLSGTTSGAGIAFALCLVTLYRLAYNPGGGAPA